MTFFEMIVETIKYIFLGLIQGITEVVPVSSSGHVAIAQLIFQIQTDEGLLFLILVNTGSLIAILYHFRKMIGRIISHFFAYFSTSKRTELVQEDFCYVWKIIVASIPAAFVGFLFSNQISGLYQDYGLFVVGIGMLITATILFVVKDYAKVNGRQTISFKDAIGIGLIQMFGLVPGLSRNGITTSTGLFRKMSMETSLNFSLLLSIPISIGSLLKYAYILIQDPSGNQLGFDPTNGYHYLFYFMAFVASIIATRYALKFLYKYFRRGRLVYFSIYLFVVGAIALTFGLLQLR